MRDTADYVRRAREDLLAEIHARATPGTVEPLEYAVYLGLYRGADLLGFSESYLYDRAFGGYEGSPIAAMFDLNVVCPSCSMAHIRSAYLESAFRRSTPHFARLYMSTALHFLGLGATHSTLVTTGMPYLNALYRKMGARFLCPLEQLPSQEGTGAALYVVDLAELLRHPFARRIHLVWPPEA